MPKYIFLDNWVFDLIRNPELSRCLQKLITQNRYTLMVTSLSLVELYNPGWQQSDGPDRVERAVEFMATVPCVVVNPRTVHEAEIAAYLQPCEVLPEIFDLKNIAPNLRSKVLLAFMRRDKLFLDQGKDIEKWSQGYRQLKGQWLGNIDFIIDEACKAGNLKSDASGELVELQEHRELFLYSLDFRHSDHPNVEEVLRRHLAVRTSGKPMGLTAARLSSLCFWYAYVAIDPTNRLKRRGSDIGDIFHVSLLPYCAAFTTDGTMYRMLQLIRERVAPSSCVVMTKALLTEELRQYA